MVEKFRRNGLVKTSVNLDFLGVLGLVDFGDWRFNSSLIFFKEFGLG